ncbi:TRAP transporter small permease [Aquisalimonas sp. 2447]|uniref:TRAP transporter small permease n=1 Tax=Aquisalimonas sp. 2447 TaxID=2740807 RepID=UPI001432342E|nr:TRAP transporter small permease [Aquisalimonas sp. 2447]QIT54483.1 TRAP transporter small permease [Aquisalimonas sp. 2447]
MLRRGLEAISRWSANVTAVVACITGITMVITLLVGIFFRYVMQASLSWPEEVALLTFTWTVFLTASLGVREDFHVRVTLLRDALPNNAAIWLERLLLVGIGGFALAMFWYGWEFAEFTQRQVSPAIRYPLWIRNAAVPVAGALMLLHVAARLSRPAWHRPDANVETSL